MVEPGPELEAQVALHGLDGLKVCTAYIPREKVGMVLTLEGRAFMWAPDSKIYLEAPTVILVKEPPAERERYHRARKLLH